MKLREANNIIANAKASMAVDGVKPPAGLESEGVRLLTSGFGYDGLVHTLNGSPNFSAAALFVRLIEVCADAYPAAFDVELLSAIHKKLYGDASSSAGSLRKRDMSQNGSSFTDYRYIPGSLKRLLNKLWAVGDSRKASKAEFTTLLTHYYTELYLLAPFEQGNGPTRRAFFWLFARSKGFAVDWFKVPSRTFAEAESLAFATDNVTELYNCLFTAVSYFNNAFDLPDSARLEKRRPSGRPTAAKPMRRQAAAGRPVKKAPAPDPVPAVSPALIEELKRQLKAELIQELAASDDTRAIVKPVPAQRVTPADRPDSLRSQPIDREPQPKTKTKGDRSPFDPLYQPDEEAAPQGQPQTDRSPSDCLYAAPAVTPTPKTQPGTPSPFERLYGAQVSDDAPQPETGTAEPVPPTQMNQDAPERNTSVTIEPPIERNGKPSRSTVRRRERADKLKQKIEKLRHNLEDLLGDDE